MKHILGLSVLIFIAGIVTARVCSFPFYFLFILTMTVGVVNAAIMRRKVISHLLLAVFIFMLGITYTRNYQTLPVSHISAYVPRENSGLCLLRGRVAGVPEEKRGWAVFPLQAEEIDDGSVKRACCGTVLVYVKGDCEVALQDSLELIGHLRMPGIYRIPGRENPYVPQGTTLIMKVGYSSRLKKYGSRKLFSLHGFASELKVKMEKIIFSFISPAAASVVDAMVLGEKKRISPRVYTTMMRTGTVHILVVSGFNVGIVLFIVTLLLKIARIPKIPRLCLSMPAVIVYCLMTGSSPPVLRATVMALFFLTASLLEKEPDVWNALAAAALVILLYDPNQLFCIGFQLSFASVVALVRFYPVMRDAVRLHKMKRGFIRYIADGFLASLAAWVGTMGLIVYYFKIISPVTVIANIVVVPLASFITLSGFCLVLTSLIFPFLARPVAMSCECAVGLLIYTNDLLSRLPWASINLPS